MIKLISIFLLFTQLIYAENGVGYDYELDPYYSNVSAFLDLDKQHKIEDGMHYTEKEIYTDMLKNSLSPNIFLIELAIHPMALAGLYFRDQHPQRYDKVKIKKFNWVKAITAGYEEPYSISFFVGRMMVFKKKHQKHIGKNRAYLGYLITLGNRSIKDNQAFNDNWIESEIKLKGTRIRDDKNLDWSFRVGSRFHSNHNFTDSIYIGARRSSIDFHKNFLSFIFNSAFDSSISFDKKNFNLCKDNFY